MIAELKRFVAIRIDVTEQDGPEAELKNQKFKAGAIPFMVFYSSADAAAKDAWYDKRRATGTMSRDAFLAKLRALK